MFADSSSSGPIFGKNPSTYSRRDARRARKRGGPSAESCVRCLLLFSRTTAAVFAKEMGCEPEFLQSMRKSARHTQFACFVRNHTEHPIALTVPFGTMEQQPKITAAAHALL